MRDTVTGAASAVGDAASAAYNNEHVQAGKENVKQ